MRLGEAEPSATASVFLRAEKSAQRSRAAGVFASAAETAIPDERSAAAIPAQRELFIPIPGRIAVRGGGGEPFHSTISPRASGALYREIRPTAAAAAPRKSAAMPRIARSSPGQ